MPNDMEGGFSMDRAMQAGASTNAYLGKKKADDVANNLAAQTKVTYDSSTDLTTVQLPSWALTKYMGDALKYQEIEGIYHQQITEKEARIQQMKSHPFMNTLSQIAASMAANDPNPYTRGIGQAAQRLNPTVSQLEEQKLSATKDLSQVVERERTQDLAYLEHEERLEAMRTNHQEQMARFGADRAEREAFHKAEAEHWKTVDAENARHHKEWEREMRDKEKQTDISKIYNTILRGQTLIANIDDHVRREQDKFQAYEESIKNPKTPYKTDADYQRALDDLETSRARLRQFINDQNEKKDKIASEVEGWGEKQKKGAETSKKTQAAPTSQKPATAPSPAPAQTPTYQPGSDPGGLGLSTPGKAVGSAGEAIGGATTRVAKVLADVFSWGK